MHSIVAVTMVACGSGGTATEVIEGSLDAGNQPNGTADGGMTTEQMTGTELAGQETVDSNAPVVFPEAQPFIAEYADTDGGAVYINSPNTARLSGAVVGSGELPTDEVFKSIAFIANDVDPRLEVLNAILHMTGSENRTAYVTILIRNNSDDVLCFVRHGLVGVYDADNNLITTNSGGDGTIFGAMGAEASGRTSDTCFSPGQIVYYTALFGPTVTIDNTVGVTIENLTVGNVGTAASVSVVPVSYEINESKIEVLIRNQSSETVTLTGSTFYVLSDTGAPIYITTNGCNIELAPGAEMILDESSTFFKGSATSIRVLVDYSL